MTATIYFVEGFNFLAYGIRQLVLMTVNNSLISRFAVDQR